MIKFLRNKYSSQEKLQFDFLRKNILFKGFSDKELNFIQPLIHERTFGKNEIVFFRNDPSLALYFVYEGEVSLYLDADGIEENLINVEKGYVFGQNSIVENAHRNYNAKIAGELATLFVIPRAGLMDVLTRHPRLHSHVLTNLSTYFNGYISKVFSKYRENVGFFEISQIYDKKKREFDFSNREANN